MVVFRLDRTKSDTKGNVSVNGRETTGATDHPDHRSGDATEGKRLFHARVEIGVDSKKNPLLAKVVGDEAYDIYS